MAAILVVEDESSVRKLLIEILSKAGYPVAATASAQEACEQIRSSPPALVVTDLLMPEMDGLELIMEIRRLQPGVRVIAVSGGGQIGPDTYLEMADNLGADFVIAKPFPPQELLRAVRELMG